MNLRLCVLLVLLPVFSLAQSSETSQWSVESVSLLTFDRHCNASSTKHINAIPLKVQQTNTLKPSGTPFRDAIIRAIQNGQWEAFTDASLSTLLPSEEVLGSYLLVDSVVTFDPETYEEKLNIVHFDLLRGAQSFKVKQKLVFNEASNRLESQALAIAPYVSEPGGKKYSPVWFQLPDPREKFFDPSHRKVSFATHLNYHLEEQKMKPIRGERRGLKKAMLTRLEKGEMTGYDDNGTPIPLEEVPNIFVKADTIFTVDPETYEESFEVVEREYRSEDINDYLVLQSWFFVPGKGQLQCRVEKVAPVVPVTDEYGTLSYYLPLFFWQRM